MQKLIDAEGLYNALVENVGIGISLVDTEYKVIMANPTLGQWLGKDAKSLIGKQCFKEYENRDAVCPHCPGAKAMETGKTHSADSGSVLKDGTRLFVCIHAVPLFDDRHKPKGFIEIIENITERKKTEALLRESEEKYRSLFENSQAGMYRSMIDGSVILDVNKKWLELIGYSKKEEIVGKPSPTVWVHPEKRESFIQQLKEKGVVANYEMELLTKDGTARACLLSATIFPEKGILEGTILDITERKKTEQELKKRVRDLEVFHKAAVGRELKMAELKKRVKELEGENTKQEA